MNKGNPQLILTLMKLTSTVIIITRTFKGIVNGNLCGHINLDITHSTAKKICRKIPDRNMKYSIMFNIQDYPQ